MKKITVRKIAKYILDFPGMSRYESYDLIARQKYSPQIDGGRKSDKVYDRIFASDLRRGKETARLYRSSGIEFLPELREVKFSLKNLMTKKEYEVHGSDLVRQRFVEAYVDNDLAEKRQNIKDRVVSVLKRLKRLPEGEYLLVSHSFFMKILEIYISKGDVFKKTDLLKKYLNPLKKTYNFQEGFEFEI